MLSSRLMGGNAYLYIILTSHVEVNYTLNKIQMGTLDGPVRGVCHAASYNIVKKHINIIIKLVYNN